MHSVPSACSTVALTGFTVVSFAASPAMAQCDVLERVASPNPGTEGSFLRGISGVSSNDIWAVGSYWFQGVPPGTDVLPLALHWDGASWSESALPELPAPPNGPSARLLGVQAFADGEVWTVGRAVPADSVDEHQTLAMRFDGEGWEIIPSPVASPKESNSEFNAIGGVASNDLWAVGHRAGFLAAHWDGSSWQAHPVPPGAFEYQHLVAVSAIASDDVWAAGQTGLGGIQPWIVHWNGSSWTTPIPQPNQSLYGAPSDIRAFSGDDIWVSLSSAGGGNPRFLHWNGSQWEDFAAPQYHYGHFAGDDPTDFYSIAYQQVMHWNGIEWQHVGTLDADLPLVGFFSATQLPNGDLWAAGRTAAGSGAQTVTARFSPCNQPVPVDLNGDASVNVLDLLILLSAWGVCASPGDCPADFNGDSAVNVFDLLQLLGNWG